jgi:hypothetical protein
MGAPSSSLLAGRGGLPGDRIHLPIGDLRRPDQQSSRRKAPFLCAVSHAEGVQGKTGTIRDHRQLVGRRIEPEAIGRIANYHDQIVGNDS